MQLLAKFKNILYMRFRATLNFRKFKVAPNRFYSTFFKLCHKLHLLTFNCSNFTYNGKRLKQTVNIEWKNSLESFSKKLKVVLLYSIKTVVSHLNVEKFIGRTLFYKPNVSNRHTRKPASMVTHSVRLVVKPWKEDISNVTEKKTV